MTTITATGSYKHYGLLYVKVPKTASSTAAGAALRIGKKYKIPVAAQEHSWPLEQEYQNRHPTQSFLFASIRDPTDRAISFLSYTASRTRALNFSHSSNNSKEEAAQNQQEEQYLLRHLREMDRSGNVVRSEGRSGAQLYFTSLHSIPKDSAWRPSHPAYVSNALRVRDNVRRVLESYDFFLVTDRMEESLVAMALLMGISTMEDILAFSSKRSSSNQYLPVQDTNNDKQNTKNHNMVCVPLRRLTIDDGKPSVQAYLTSAEWYAMNYGDFLLHAAVSESLNRTIDEVLGRDRFENALTDYRRLLDGATRACVQDEDNQHPHVHWPCSSQGVLQLKEAMQDCYHGDSGCGYRCIDDWLAASGV